MRPFVYVTVMMFLLMVDLELLSGPFLFLFLLPLDDAGALIFFLILFNSQLGYLQDVSAFWRCSCSSSRCCLVEHTALALGNNVLMTLYLPVMAWWVSHCKYWLVWVGFLYTVVSILPSLKGVTRVTRKGIDPSGTGVFSSKLDALFYGIYVVEEFFFVGCFYDNKWCHQQIFSTDLGGVVLNWELWFPNLLWQCWLLWGLMVMLNKEDYIKKAEDLLSQQTYPKIPEDLTSKQKTKLINLLKNIKAEGGINDETYKRMYPTGAGSPKFYGLPKIHKPGIPLRPIVSSRGTVTYNSAKELAKILKPLVGDVITPCPKYQGLSGTN